jgi:glycine/serine hydroxymethyltransferase
MVKIAIWIKRLLIDKENPNKIKKEVINFLKNFPLPYLK